MVHHNHSNIGAAASTTLSSIASSASTTATISCPTLRSPVNDAGPIAGSLSFHTLSEYLCIGFAGVASIIAIILIFLHAMHLSRPREQIRIMRLTALIPTFAFLSVGNSYLGISAIYLLPWMDVCESISLMNFFLLIHAYLADANVDDIHAPLDSIRNDPASFSAVVWNSPTQERFIPKTGAMTVRAPTASRARLGAYQYIAVALLCAILTDITQAFGLYCLNSNNYHFAHLWIELIRTGSVVFAVFGILRFTSLNKHCIAEHKPMLKLVAFKLIVFLEVVQSVIFSYAGNHITPTTKFSYVDLTIGLPAVILCAELVIFAVVFHLVYQVTPYKRAGSSPRLHYQGGPMGIIAIFTAFNPLSVIIDIARGY